MTPGSVGQENTEEKSSETEPADQAPTPSGKRTRGTEPYTWITTLLDQLEDPLGAAITLSKLLSANEELLMKFATPSLVESFVSMIQELGPQPRLLQFFKSICTSGGKPIKVNQEMVLR